MLGLITFQDQIRNLHHVQYHIHIWVCCQLFASGVKGSMHNSVYILVWISLCSVNFYTTADNTIVFGLIYIHLFFPLRASFYWNNIFRWIFWSWPSLYRSLLCMKIVLTSYQYHIHISVYHRWSWNTFNYSISFSKHWQFNWSCLRLEFNQRVPNHITLPLWVVGRF